MDTATSDGHEQGGAPVEYVMVPVPEEIARDVEQFVVGLDMRTRAGEAAANFDAEAAELMMSTLNPRCRIALSLVAAEAARGVNLNIRDLAARAGWTEHDTAGVVAELSELVWAAVGPIIMLVPSRYPRGDEGSVDWSERVVFLGKELAVAVVAADDRPAERA